MTMTEIPGFIALHACPACGNSSGNREVYRSPYGSGAVREYLERFYAPVGKIDFAVLADAVYVIDLCPACGTAYQCMVPNGALLDLLYEHWITPASSLALHTRRTLDEQLLEQREITALVAYAGRPQADLEVLDFGGGWGGWALHARALGCRVALAELSPSRIAHATASGTEVVSLDSLGARQFDLVNCEQVFEHLTDPAGILGRLVACTKPGGLIRINVPNGHDIARRLRRMDWSAAKGTADSLNLLSPMEHLVAFTPRGLRLLAAAAGLERVRMPLSHQWRHMLDTRSCRGFLRSLAKPPYYNSSRSTHLLFRRPSDANPPRTATRESK